MTTLFLPIDKVFGQLKTSGPKPKFDQDFEAEVCFTIVAILTKLRIDPSPQKTSGRLLISGKWSSIFVPCRAEGGGRFFRRKCCDFTQSLE